MHEIKHIPSLSNAEQELALGALQDFDTYALGNWIIVGSLSYRIFTPKVDTQPGLRDLDLMVTPKPGQDPKTLISPGFQEDFTVLRMHESGDGYYYRLVHRRTHIGVDVFPGKEEPHELVRIGDRVYRVALAEATAFHGMVHLIMLRAGGEKIDKKLPFNVKKLWRAVDQERVLAYFNQHPERYRPYLPMRLKNACAADVVKYALSIKYAGQKFQTLLKPRTEIGSVDTKHRKTQVHTKTIYTPRPKLQQLIQHKFFRLRMTLGV